MLVPEGAGDDEPTGDPSADVDGAGVGCPTPNVTEVDATVRWMLVLTRFEETAAAAC